MRVVMKTLTGCLQGGAILLLLTYGFAQVIAAPFSIAISAPEAAVKRGSQVKVGIKLTNISNREIEFFDTNRYCDYAVEVRDPTGSLAPEGEYKRSLLCPNGTGRVMGWRKLVRLKPKEFREDEIFVSSLYNMSQPGKYSVEVMRKAPKEFGEVEARSNLITVTVTE
jgi:hypothetical protein